MFQARRLDFKGSPSCQRTCDGGRWINTYFCVITKQFVVPMPSRVNWSSFSEVCLNEKPKAIHLFMSFSENPGPSCLLNSLVRHKVWRLRPSVRKRWVGHIKIHQSDVTFFSHVFRKYIWRTQAEAVQEARTTGCRRTSRKSEEWRATGRTLRSAWVTCQTPEDLPKTSLITFQKMGIPPQWNE